MGKLATNTAYQVMAYSNKGYIQFIATRRYSSATYNGHTEFGFLGWEVITRKFINGDWKRVRFEGYPENIANKKAVINFLSEQQIFSQAYSEFKK